MGQGLRQGPSSVLSQNQRGRNEWTGERQAEAGYGSSRGAYDLVSTWACSPSATGCQQRQDTEVAPSVVFSPRWPGLPWGEGTGKGRSGEDSLQWGEDGGFNQGGSVEVM